ncbi:MAG: peptide deformylase [Patescibacteria group bacterium]|nr:peptide deformylase [Patescibacteria group bacterium]
MVKKILQYKNPKLRKISKEVKKIDPKIMDIIQDMVDSMRESGGVGISAPQIGVLKRISIYEYIKPKGSSDPTPDIPLTILINPKVTKNSRKKEKAEEGCLSFPTMYGHISRSAEITVEALGINNKMIEFDAKGLEARIIQHEIDHLDGVLFIDRLHKNDRIYTYQY